MAQNWIRPSAVPKQPLECQAFVFPQFPLCDQHLYWKPNTPVEVQNGRKNAKGPLFSTWSHDCLTLYGGWAGGGAWRNAAGSTFFLTCSVFAADEEVGGRTSKSAQQRMERERDEPHGLSQVDSTYQSDPTTLNIAEIRQEAVDSRYSIGRDRNRHVRHFAHRCSCSRRDRRTRVRRRHRHRTENRGLRPR